MEVKNGMVLYRETAPIIYGALDASRLSTKNEKYTSREMNLLETRTQFPASPIKAFYLRSGIGKHTFSPREKDISTTLAKAKFEPQNFKVFKKKVKVKNLVK